MLRTTAGGMTARQGITRRASRVPVDSLREHSQQRFRWFLERTLKRRWCGRRRCRARFAGDAVR